MRAYDRDLIRGGHYGQRSCEPHSKAEHMAAPTKSCDVKKVLANSEPSTHGTQRLFARLRFMTGLEVQRTWLRAGAIRHFDPKRRGGVAIKSSELVGQAHAP